MYHLKNLERILSQEVIKNTWLLHKLKDHTYLSILIYPILTTTQSAQAVRIKYHRLDGYTIEFISHSSCVWKFKIKLLENSAPDECPLPDLHMTFFSLFLLTWSVLHV